MFPKTKKSFGQNWLVDKDAIKKIVESSGVKKGDNVLEIGPGTGVITEELVKIGANITVVELDFDLIEPLRNKFGDKINIIHGDILKISMSDFSHLKPYKLVSALPYNITSKVLRKFLVTSDAPEKITFVLQNEVVDRIVASPPNMSLLSVVCQIYSKCKKVCVVPSDSFHPEPKVDSAIVTLELIKDENILNKEGVISIAKIGFSSRRKQLHKNLLSITKLETKQIKELLIGIDLSEKVRAQELTVDEWVKIAQKLT